MKSSMYVLIALVAFLAIAAVPASAYTYQSANGVIVGGSHGVQVVTNVDYGNSNFGVTEQVANAEVYRSSRFIQVTGNGKVGSSGFSQQQATSSMIRSHKVAQVTGNVIVYSNGHTVQEAGSQMVGGHNLFQGIINIKA